mgnify:CR=1 FL=1
MLAVTCPTIRDEANLTMPPIIGVVTRTKDRTVLLTRALESVLNQTYQNWIQVIVNDGGNAAEVDELIRDYAPQYEGRLRVLHHATSKGMEAASNAGLKYILNEVDYVVIHDDDDSWAPDFLKIALAELTLSREEIPTVRGVITQANCVYEEINGALVNITDVEPFLPWVNQGIVSFDSMLHQCQFAPIQFLYHKDVLNEIGFYREDLPVLGDWEFNLRFLKRYDICIVPHYLAFYHHRRSLHGSYSNSVFGAKDKHELHRQRLKNEWVRDDLKSGAAGLGALANERVMLEQLNHRLQQMKDRLDRLAGTKPQEKIGVKAARLLIETGRPFHYLRRFVYFLRRNGLRSALARARFWLQIKSGQIVP